MSPRSGGRSGLVALVTALRSRRTVAVVLLSFSSGLPLGLVWFAIPDWLRDIGVDIRLVGLVTLAQAPWAFKVVWAPLMDRFAPPFWGRRRGWMAITQLALLVSGLMLAGVGRRPETLWVVGAIALVMAMAAASQDIAYDAYVVDVLRPEEQGAAVGPKTAMYRAAMAVSGGAAITLAARWGWPVVNVLLALVYLPMLALTGKAPEPEEKVQPPVTLRDALWQPFVGFLARPRAIEILAFVVLYKFADQLAQALTRPFLIDMGYSADHRGLALATVGLVATMTGAFIGGWVTTLVGLGNGLWMFGLLQIFSNVGYYVLARLADPNLWVMYGATSFELFTAGLGTGAFSVLLLRMTEKRFSATQYALFSSLFALPRLLAGPIAGFAVHAIGWPTFYLATMVVGIPGLVMLARFAPLGVREPTFAIDEIVVPRVALSRAGLLVRGVLGAAATGAAGLAVVVVLTALGTSSEASPQGIDVARAFLATIHPAQIADWVQLGGLVVFATMGGLFVAAAIASRRGSKT